jgi:putative peptide zinc metalloprotease protein
VSIDNETPAPQQTLRVPERPGLAPDVVLKGQMTESAFEDPPWLIDRDGVFIVVPKLLFEVAAQVDGRHDHQQIAEAVTAATQRGVTTEHVEILLSKLMLMGVVAGPDGKPAVPPASLAQARSIMGLDFKLRMLSPRVIEPIAGAFRFLYWPPILLLALAVAFGAEVWLYAIHGIGESFRQAVYTAGLMLIIVAVVVVATLFHEFGHAAALRYAGGKVRAMGVGLYIVYPAFYTDVTDNYRLPRKDRLRTDLGGFYFNLLFVILLMGLYALTGAEFLLAIVVILNIEILHQMLPFVRFDGYWALADLTGIPDFFSQMGSFLRSVLPSWIPIPDGPKLPPLKTWGKLFYAGYLAVAIPFLLFMLYLTLRTLPRFIATVADASTKLIAELQTAAGSAELVTGGAIVVQLIFLALPVMGLTLLFARLARRGAGLAWTWGTRSPAHGLVTATATATTTLLLALLWIPGIFGPGPAPIAGVMQFTPFTKGERYTIGDAIGRDLLGEPTDAGSGSDPVPGASAPSDAPGLAPASGGPLSSASPGSSPGSPTPTPRPVGSAAPGSTAIPAPTSTPTPAPTPTATPTPTPAPTPELTPPPSPDPTPISSL